METVDLQDIFTGQVVTEMATGVNTLVPLNPELVESITQGDDDPVFAVYEIESGWSNNKRYWPPEALASIAEQVNNANDPVVGYRGHVPADQDGHLFPEIGVHWLKAVTQVSQDKVKLFIKGYALPGTSARQYIKRKLAKTVSVSGKALLRPIQGGVAVREFDLESIDLARPRSAGMRTKLVSVTQEMENDVKPEEIAALQLNELRAHNPTLVKTIEDGATKPYQDRVAEMDKSEGEAKANVDLLAEIRKTLGVDEDADLLEALGNSMTKIKESAKLIRQKIIDEVLEKKFKNEKTRGLVQRVLVTEMESELSDSMTDDEMKTKVTEMVEKAVEEDETLKSFLSESGGGHSLTASSTDERGGRKIEAGYENERISVRKAGGR
jgi:tRNA(Ser,Leu) C12 N-acetylase TAN1